MIKIQVANIPRLNSEFDPKRVDKAYKSALRKTAGKAKTQVSQKVRKTYEVSAANINKVSKISNISQGAVITWIGEQVGLVHFKALKKNITLPKKTNWGNKRVGVTVKIMKAGKRKYIKSGFKVAKLNNHVFERNGKKMKDPTKDAIRKMSGISIPQMVNKRILNETADFVEQEMPVQFERAFKFFIGKK